jgi:hypothetical protein
MFELRRALDVCASMSVGSEADSGNFRIAGREFEIERPHGPGRPDPKDSSIIRKRSPKGDGQFGNLIDCAIRLSRHEAMILGMDVPLRDASSSAEYNRLTIDGFRELLERHHRDTAELRSLDVTAQDVAPALKIEQSEPELSQLLCPINNFTKSWKFGEN